MTARLSVRKAFVLLAIPMREGLPEHAGRRQKSAERQNSLQPE
jgi:hypothetical protein